LDFPWANWTDDGNEVAIWIIKNAGSCRWTIPPASEEVNRTIYFCKGDEALIAGVEISPYHAIVILSRIRGTGLKTAQGK